MAGAAIAPVLPELIQHLQLDPAIAGNVVSLHFLTLAISTPLLGVLADRVGKLRLLLVCLWFYGLFGVAGVGLQSLEGLLIIRGLLGVATGGVAAAGLGLLSCLYRGEERIRAIAYISSTITLANIVYPLLGGLLGAIHWRLAFGLYGLSLPLACWTYGVFRQTKQRSQHLELVAVGAVTPAHPKPAPLDLATVTRAERLPLAQMLCQPQTLRLLFSQSLTAGTVYATVVYLPLYLHATLGTGTGINGLILAAQALGAALIAAFGVQRLARSLGPTVTITAGLGVMAAVLILIPQLQHLGGLLPTAMLFGLAFGSVVPMLYTLLAESTPEHLQASILAAGTGAGFLGQFLSPIVLGAVFAGWGLSGVFYAAAASALGIGGLMMVPLAPKNVT